MVRRPYIRFNMSSVHVLSRHIDSMHISRLFSSSSATGQPLQRASKNAASGCIAAIQELHGRLVRLHLHTDPASMADVIRSYALSPPNLLKARLAFDHIERPTSLVSSHMIRGLSQGDRPIEAIRMYRGMHRRGLPMNNQTLVFVFKACGRISSLVNGEQIHSHAFKSGFASFLHVSNALIHLYGCCGHLGLARKVFDKMSGRDLVSWNSLICAYSQNERYTEVLDLFDAMRASDVKADCVTLVKVLIACGHLGNTEYMDSAVMYMEESNIDLDVYLGNTLIDMYGRRGKTELAQRVFNRMADRNIVSWNAMITAHAKACNSVAARNLFDQMPKRDVISWTSMITCYCHVNQFSDAVRLFQEMMAAKVKADEKTVASVLSACARLGLLDVGVAVHDYIQENSVKMDIYVGNALIDMYCKCGLFKKSLEVFREMKARDSVSWTSVISGLAVNGFASDAVDLFSQMLCEGFQPTHGTFVGILLACAHAGLVDKGLSYFESMEKDYGLVPEMKHYGCMVDVLSRSGQLDEAYKFIKKMPVEPDVVVWRILLSACKVHGDMALAEIVTKKILELDPHGSGNYVLLSNSYAGADRWHDATKVRERMESIDSQKPSGYSTIELIGVM